MLLRKCMKGRFSACCMVCWKEKEMWWSWMSALGCLLVRTGRFWTTGHHPDASGIFQLCCSHVGRCRRHCDASDIFHLCFRTLWRVITDSQCFSALYSLGGCYEKLTNDDLITTFKSSHLLLIVICICVKICSYSKHKFSHARTRFADCSRDSGKLGRRDSLVSDSSNRLWSTDEEDGVHVHFQQEVNLYSHVVPIFFIHRDLRFCVQYWWSLN